MTDLVFYFCTFVISVSCIVYFLSRKVIQKEQSRVFLWLMISVAASALADMISCYLEWSMEPTRGVFTVQYTCQLIYFLIHVMLSPLYALYTAYVTGVGMRRDRVFYIFFFMPVLLVQALILTNPLTNWMFYYDELGKYHRGPFLVASYIVALLYLVFSIYNMIRYRKAMTVTTNIALWYFFSFTIVGVIVQLIFPVYKVELFAESISMLGVLLMVENEEEFMDASSRVYNRRAFMSDNRRYILSGHRYAVITLTMTNLRLYTRMMSYNSMSEVLRAIMAWIKGLSENATVYRVTTNSIGIILLYRRESQVEEMVKILKERFEEGWVYGTYYLELNTIIRVAHIPDEISEPDMVLELAEETGDIECPGVQLQRGNQLYYITRRVQVEEALKRALNENHFEVYYQPIWDAATDSILSAEALLRLSDPVLGNLSPEELIPIAERNGLISEVGLRVFDEVCAFMAEKRTKRLGLKYIEINLSIYQLVSGNAREKFQEIMKKYQIRPEQINLEITETASFSVGVTPVAAITELKQDGFTFSLDDYGTGYSNLTYIINMEFLNIKCDKSLLWAAMEDEHSKVLLNDTIKMIRRMGIYVIQEGVETREQLDLVVEAGANSVQGFFFSRPIKQDAFVRYVENFRGYKTAGENRA